MVIPYISFKNKNMKQHILFIIVILSTIFYINSQTINSPANMNEAVQILQKDCPSDLKTLIKETKDDSLIQLCYPWGGEYKTIFEWVKKNNNSKIKKYLQKKGISDQEHQQAVIMIAFKQYILYNAFDEKSIYKPYQDIEKKWAKEYRKRYITDSIRGIYIPYDLLDCIDILDSMWNDFIKSNFKSMSENDFVLQSYYKEGTWIRNNWQLWNGSRLVLYFNELGIYHPDDISGIILKSYHRHLTGNAIRLEEQVKYYYNYWRKQMKKK